MLWHYDGTWHRIRWLKKSALHSVIFVIREHRVILQGTYQGQSPGLVMPSSVTQKDSYSHKNWIWIPSEKALLSRCNIYTRFQDATLDYAGLIQSGNSDSNHELNLLLPIALNESDVLYCPHSENWNWELQPGSCAAVMTYCTAGFWIELFLFPPVDRKEGIIISIR